MPAKDTEALKMRIAASSQNDKTVISSPRFRQGRHGKISCKHHSDDRHSLILKTSIEASLSMTVAAWITKPRWALRRPTTSATPTASMPEGWLDEEVGYLGETPMTLRIRAGMHGQRRD
ncbi:hypothetical protein [Paraburkholderia sp. Cpub6]|uniref:hypothetical protein n=1 Tax=Paraburkholderia sp. Cpub6 TaxID=2723094 RepID=UPI001609B155|nr:hypothetical protein [Paraburkholderia sp. Cpub6]MBB5457010.1 hypothetical protein [Paraburkholderia sp. Cpub6]